jgi:AcrR family transcriptional regulator
MARYRSPLRDAQAAQTRARILDAAGEVFGRLGFAGASLARIAEHAGVSVETVKLVGTKGALLLAAFDRAFSGREMTGPISASEEGTQMLQAPDQELVPRLVDFIAGANARVADLWPRVLEAAAGDADVAARLAQLQASRAEDMSQAVHHLRARGLCRSPRPDGELADVLSYLLAPEGYVRLVRECGWPPEDYRSWVVGAVERLVLAA